MPGADRPTMGHLDALRRARLLDTATEQSFDRVTSLVARLLEVPVVFVSLVDSDRQFLKSSLGLPEPWASCRETPLSHSFCTHVVAAEAPLRVVDATGDERFRASPAIAELGVVAYLGHPIRFEGHTIGSLCAIDARPRDWLDQDAELLQTLAEQLEDLIELRALTMAWRERDARTLTSERARHDAETAALEDANRELRLAKDLDRRLQHALLPPRPAGGFLVERIYRPGTRGMLVGGDFADVRARPDGSLGFVIGDVTGHGPEAAALGITLRVAWGALVDQLEPAELLAALNAALRREREDDMLMATAIAGTLAPDGSSASLAIAGHPPPVLLGPPARILDRDLARGRLLGFHGDDRWTAEEVPLGRDGLLLYTDGLVEIEGLGMPRGDDPGPALVALVTEHLGVADGRSLPVRLLADVVARNGGPLGDDVAIVHLAGVPPQA